MLVLVLIFISFPSWAEHFESAVFAIPQSTETSFSAGSSAIRINAFPMNEIRQSIISTAPDYRDICSPFREMAFVVTPAFNNCRRINDNLWRIVINGLGGWSTCNIFCPINIYTDDMGIRFANVREYAPEADMPRIFRRSIGGIIVKVDASQSDSRSMASDEFFSRQSKLNSRLLELPVRRSASIFSQRVSSPPKTSGYKHEKCGDNGNPQRVTNKSGIERRFLVGLCFLGFGLYLDLLGGFYLYKNGSLRRATIALCISGWFLGVGGLLWSC